MPSDRRGHRRTVLTMTVRGTSPPSSSRPITMAAVTLVAALAAAMLAGCGPQVGKEAPPAGEDGRVNATPRALASVIIDHVDPGEPRRSTGHWADPLDPPAIEAQVDYGENPEGFGDGPTRTVRVEVTDMAAYTHRDRKWFTCRPEDQGRCESEDVAEGTLLYRWFPGTPEEEPGSYAWTLLRSTEVVQVSYEGSDLFTTDPRVLDLPVDPDDLRAAALDPELSLRTTTTAWEAGQALRHYVGVEKAPQMPHVVPTTPRQLASRVVDYLEIKPTSVRRSHLTDLGPVAVGARLSFDGTAKYDPFTLDILTTVGRVPQIDPLPCPVQRSGEAAERACFAWDDDTAATWTLAHGGRPGVLWIIGAQDDDTFNRVESVAIRVESVGLVEPYFTVPGNGSNRLPQDLLAIAPLTGDLSVGPETRVSRKATG